MLERRSALCEGVYRRGFDLLLEVRGERSHGEVISELSSARPGEVTLWQREGKAEVAAAL